MPVFCTFSSYIFHPLTLLTLAIFGEGRSFCSVLLYVPWRALTCPLRVQDEQYISSCVVRSTSVPSWGAILQKTRRLLTKSLNKNKKGKHSALRIMACCESIKDWGWWMLSLLNVTSAPTASKLFHVITIRYWKTFPSTAQQKNDLNDSSCKGRRFRNDLNQLKWCRTEIRGKTYTVLWRASISYVNREVNAFIPRRDPDKRWEHSEKMKPVSHTQDENPGIPVFAMQSTRCLTKTWPSKVVWTSQSVCSDVFH